jgi:predicted ATPase/DNA-binding SARP family transcriptional activator
MPPRLALYFLGIPELKLNNTPITTDRRKAVALLAYLAVNRGKYTREFLSGLLWPDYDQAKAFSNLRRTIWEVHQAIGEGWLLTDRESVSLIGDGNIDLDVAQFRDLLSHQQTDIQSRISLLSDAVKLYRNHFLTGFSLKDAYPFNEWAYAESEELRQQLAKALTRLSEDYCALGQAEKAIPYARRLISLDPLSESAHRQLMEVYLQAGQHNAALKQYQTCEQVLRKELNLDPQPETRALYKKIRKGEIKSVRIEEKAEAIEPKHNLPPQLSSFIGREKETDDIANLLTRNRLVTLAGVGGIGKTSLSLQVGQKLLNNYPDGIWFIPLDSLADPALVPQTVASVFDIREGSERPIIEILKHALRQKTALLILDNCEHLLKGCAQLINALLTSCLNLKVLATSRETLNIAGEAIYYMPALSLPEQDNTSFETLAEYEALELFAERAMLAFSSFTLTKENAQTVANICRRVDGIPLAIELAAARVNILHVEEILKQLQDSFSLLTSDGRIALQRHQTLQASMDWSWRLLSEAEQTFLRQLAVFAGGWTLESAQAICDGDSLNLISSLVGKSLIVVDQATGRVTRYRFHEIVRQYAREKLHEAGCSEIIQDRHLAYFVKMSEQAELELYRSNQVFWLNKLDDELDNLRRALEWALATNLKLGLQLIINSGVFWEVRGDIQEVQHWLAQLLEHYEEADSLRARALAIYSNRLATGAKLAKAQIIANQSLELSRAISDKHAEAFTLWSLGAVMALSGNIRQGIPIVEQSLVLYRSLEDKLGQANATGWLGLNTNDLERSRLFLFESLRLHRELGNLSGIAFCLNRLILSAILEGDFTSPVQWLEDAIIIHRQLGRRRGEVDILGYYGMLSYWQGDYQHACSYFEESIALGEKIGISELDWQHVHMAYARLRQDNVAEAKKLFEFCVQQFQKANNTIGLVYAIEGLASLHLNQQQAEQAARIFAWADVIRENIGYHRPPVEQASVERDLAVIQSQLDIAGFAKLSAEGRAMTLEQATALALHTMEYT